MATARMAIHQLDAQLFTARVRQRDADADDDRGRSRCGGKKRMTLLGPKALNSTDTITYSRPAHATPMPGIGNPVRAVPLFFTQFLYRGVAAQECEGGAQERGHLAAWSAGGTAACPDRRTAASPLTLRPVKVGTSTVAPNMAKTCWKPSRSIFPGLNLALVMDETSPFPILSIKYL